MTGGLVVAVHGLSSSRLSVSSRWELFLVGIHKVMGTDGHESSADGWALGLLGRDQLL